MASSATSECLIVLELMGEEHCVRRDLYTDLNPNRQLHHDLLYQQAVDPLCAPLFSSAQNWTDALSSGMYPTTVVWEACPSWQGKTLEEGL